LSSLARYSKKQESRQYVTELAEIARTIFANSLKTVDLSCAVNSQVSVGADALHLAGSVIPLSEIDEVVTIAVGKAAAAMYSAVEQVVARAPGLRRRGIIVGPSDHRVLYPNTDFFAGSHPIPDEASLSAARAALAVLSSASARTAIIFLISGGASAMMEQALDESISYQDIASFYNALINSGLSIGRMNALRKHMSAVKGGRLAAAGSAALIQLTLLVSDVPASTPDSIGSGPTLPDSTTLADCREIMDELDQHAHIPQNIRTFLTKPACPETPRPDSDIFARSTWRTILSSEDLAEAASVHARNSGFHVEIDNRCDEWEYREAGAYLLDRSAQLAERHRRSCLISVGEVGIRLSAKSGIGGRNGHFALWCAQQAALRQENVTILSAGSDGIDGNSKDAGAVCDQYTAQKAHKLGLSAKEALLEFNTAPLLHAIDASITCGPTGNNLRDLRLLLRSS
jgi:glycerate 2-kinase